MGKSSLGTLANIIKMNIINLKKVGTLICIWYDKLLFTFLRPKASYEIHFYKNSSKLKTMSDTRKFASF